MVNEPIKHEVEEQLYIMCKIADMVTGGAQRNCRKAQGYLCGTFFEDFLLTLLMKNKGERGEK